MTISELTVVSLSKRGLVQNHSYENEFNLHMLMKYPFPMKGWASRLALRKRLNYKVIQ